VFLVLGAGWALGALLGLAWRWRRGWLWLPPLGLGAFGLEAPAPLRVAVALGGLALLVWALSALSGGLGGRGAAGADNGRRTTKAEAETARKRARGARLERVSWGAEPPRRVWPVEALVPRGPRPRWRLRWHPVPLEREERGYVTTVIGSGGTGKSYLLVDLAVALLTGGRWLGQRVLRLRSVLYVDAELDADTMRERGP
jgi:hypothetical protein